MFCCMRAPELSSRPDCLQSAWNSLAAADTQTYPGICKLDMRIINPGSLSPGELWGSFTPGTTQWKDGLATAFLRQAAGDESDVTRVLVLDGPIDASVQSSLATVCCVASSARPAVHVSNASLCLPCHDAVHYGDLWRSSRTSSEACA